jgi:hypothetical protein
MASGTRPAGGRSRALTAIRFNPALRAFYARLTDPGRAGGPEPKMRPVGACMRKLVMICSGVLRSRTPFDPSWASKKTR